MISAKSDNSVYQVNHYINGEYLSAEGKQLTIYNPATGESVGKVAVADHKIVNKAVIAAEQAYISWSKTTPLQRAKLMFRYKFLLEKNLSLLAEMVTRENGKTIAESLGSIQRGIDVVDYASNIPTHLKGSFTDKVATDVDCYSLYQPLGVCAGITPFNFPAMIPLWMFPMAIACGNTFILKPSEKDPSCANRLVELAKEAGIPDGVINVIHGDKDAVDALLTHSKIKAISFVGSSAVAEHVYKTAINHNKRAQCFGGAKNHCVVMPDANLDEVAKVIVNSAYGCAGERCMAISVVVAVGDQVADKLVKKMQPIIEQLRIGPGENENVDMGPLVTESHYNKVKNYIETGKKEGARLVIDGSKRIIQNKGFFMAGYLFDHVKPTMRIYQEEIFGPILCIVRVENFDDALEMINQQLYGNGTAVFTRDGAIARRFAEEVEVGMVGINVAIPVPVAHMSFGGWKHSIFADIGMYGNESIRFYTRLKTVTQRWSLKD